MMSHFYTSSFLHHFLSFTLPSEPMLLVFVYVRSLHLFHICSKQYIIVVMDGNDCGNVSLDNSDSMCLPLIPDAAENPSSGVTKNELKRLKREEYWAIKKKQRKEALKDKKRLVRQEQSSPKRCIEEGVVNDRKTKEEKKREYVEACRKSFAVVIDCDFELHHKDRPLRSLAQQIAFCYAFNKRCPHPSIIQLTGVGEKLRTQLTKTNAQAWLGFDISNACYTALTKFCIGPPAVLDDTDIDKLPLPSAKQLVYLTSDASETLNTLDNNCAYIIGGIVDRNSLKGITYKKATSQGIRTARLPIREHMALTGSHVLTVNQVLEILLVFRETGSWAETLERTMPKRKEKDANKRKFGECNNENNTGEAEKEEDDYVGTREIGEDGLTCNEKTVPTLFHS